MLNSFNKLITISTPFIFWNRFSGQLLSPIKVPIIFGKTCYVCICIFNSCPNNSTNPIQKWLKEKLEQSRWKWYWHRVKLKRGKIISKVAFLFFHLWFHEGFFSMIDVIIVQTRLKVNVKLLTNSFHCVFFLSKYVFYIKTSFATYVYFNFKEKKVKNSSSKIISTPLCRFL